MIYSDAPNAFQEHMLEAPKVNDAALRRTVDHSRALWQGGETRIGVLPGSEQSLFSY